MGLLNQNNKKDDKKAGLKAQKGGAQNSKFLNKNVNSGGFAKKTKPGSANRGS